MAPTLTQVLAWLIYPSRRRQADVPFHYSHALNEAGSYETDFPAFWQPLSLKGDPAIEHYLPERKSRKFYNMFCPLIPERAALARQILLHWGAIKPDFALTQYYDWLLVEAALDKKIEYANGSDTFPSDEWPRVRPKYYAFMIDLCCLAYESALKVRPKAKAVFQNDVPSLASINSFCFPEIMEGSRVIYSPFTPDWEGGVVASKPGNKTAHFAYMFELLNETLDNPPVEDLEAEIHEWLDDIVDETGQLPDEGEFVAMMTDSKITFDEVPTFVWKRLGIENP